MGKWKPGKRGRPPLGSGYVPKNKRTTGKRGRPRSLSAVIKRARQIDESEFRNLRGRPKGSTKSKHISLNIDGQHYSGTVKKT